MAGSRYIAIFLDALFFFLRIETVEKEPILFAMGVWETGEYEIMGFYLASKESHLSYTAVIRDLYDRGVREHLPFIADGLPKLDEEIRRVFPRADFHLCTINANRNFESYARVQDRDEIDSDLKRTFLSRTREEARNQFTEFKNKWSKRYPRAVYNMEKNLDI